MTRLLPSAASHLGEPPGSPAQDDSAGRALNEPEFLEVSRDILNYILREMTSPEGGFYSSQDADSEGVEGKFFVWEPEEVEDILGAELTEIAERYFDISVEGNFEGSRPSPTTNAAMTAANSRMGSRK